MRLLQSAPLHVGLGTGTQLGLAVATALYRIQHCPVPDATTLAMSVGRGLRSSIGTHGFLQGGLLFEGGKAPGESLGPLAARVALPSRWRVVQLCPPRRVGLSGHAEKRAFGTLPPVPRTVTERLVTLVQEQLLPAARAANLDALGEAVYRYGYEAGMCFAAYQGGPFASTELASWVAALRHRGIRGVGQSSWGPTLFALTEGPEQADDLVSWARHRCSASAEVQLRISPIANQGLRIVLSNPTRSVRATTDLHCRCALPRNRTHWYE